MKMITAIFRPEKLQPVKDALKEAGINALTITEVRGRGQQSGIVFSNRVGSLVVDEIEKTRIDIVVEDCEEDATIEAIRNAASTGHMGDGRIFVMPVERSIRIRD
ncbi:nitrogen regulatory protein P-II [Thermoplasmatales archaeon BRNA1]|nr:nitrogen regulatory protein P-II [Thermoplasmatales archaeon BRNA1]